MELDNLDIESRILGIRQTLEKLGKDMTDDEFSEIKGEDWDSAEAEQSVRMREKNESPNEDENFTNLRNHKVLGHWVEGETSEALVDYDLISSLKEREIDDMKRKINRKTKRKKKKAR